MQELIIHIGRHKSGTSSLQRFLVDNAAVLLEHGWYYPSHGRGRRIAHHNLATYFNPRQIDRLSKSEQRELSNEVNLFREEVSARPKVILSSENFQNVDPDNLVQEFSDTQLTIVVYLREIISYFLSAYSQAIKANKLTLDQTQFLKKRFRANYFSHLSRWKKAFPEAKLIVRLFDKEALHKQDIRHDFLHATGLLGVLGDTVLEFIDYDSNPSIAGDLLAFKRELNKHPYESVIPEKRLYYYLQELARGNKAYSRFVGIEPELKQALMDGYKDQAYQTERLFGLKAGSLINAEFPCITTENISKHDHASVCAKLNLLCPGLGNDLQLFCNPE